MTSTISKIGPFFVPLIFAAIPAGGVSTSGAPHLYLDDSLVHAEYAKDALLAGATVASPAPLLGAGVTERGVTSSQTTVPKLLDIKLTAPIAADWLDVAYQKVAELGDLKAGWMGEHSLGPTTEVLYDAAELAWRLATELPDISAPMISAGDEGQICFHWRANEWTASLSSYGDGTFAYYAEGHGEVSRSDSEPVSQPLPQALIFAMVGRDRVFGAAA